jgi:hypothetical protein
MTNLSPAAQQVYDSFWGEGYIEAGEFPSRLAAALRAAADQVVPEDGDPIYGLTPTEADRQVVRRKFLAIADELEAL